MNVTPTVPDADFRNTTARETAQELRHGPEGKFQDAVESRRAERSREAAKESHAHASRDRADDTEGSSDVSKADRSESVDESAVDGPEGDDTSVREPGAEPRNSTSVGSRDPEESATRDDAAPHRAAPTSQNASPIASAARTEETSGAALALPVFGQAALEALLAGALHAGSNKSSSSALSGSLSPDVPALNGAGAGPRGTPRTAVPAEQLAAKAPITSVSTSAAIGIDLGDLSDHAGAPKHTAAGSESLARAPIGAADPRGALAAFATTATADAAATRAPDTARLSPAELPAFLERLAVRIDAPERSAVVHLEPAELGRLSIALSVEPGGHVRAELHAQRPEGYAALEARLSELQASLIERGFTSATLNLSLGQADSQARQSRAQSEHRNSSSAGRKTLADAEVRALSPASIGAVDLWA